MKEMYDVVEYRFSASGREDVDVKMLGSGRVEIILHNTRSSQSSTYPATTNRQHVTSVSTCRVINTYLCVVVMANCGDHVRIVVKSF